MSKQRRITPAPGQGNFFDVVKMTEDEYFAYCVMLQKICIGTKEEWDLMLRTQAEQSWQSGQSQARARKWKVKHPTSKKEI